MASSLVPKTVPNVIAIRQNNIQNNTSNENENQNQNQNDNDNELNKLPNRINKPDGSVWLGKSFATAKHYVSKDFRERMRYYKRRILPNSHEMVINFNKRSQPEEIPDHNDPEKIDYWNQTSSLKQNQQKKFITGNAALQIPPPISNHYKIRWPIQNGCFNESLELYNSSHEVLGDLQIILSQNLESELSINSSNYKNFNTLLIVPDLYDKSYVTNFISLLLQMGFANVGILQESIAATFGAGVSNACVVDIGSQKTSICCVEEGMCIPDSRINLKFGGDDITNVFIKLLLQSNFPYKSIDLKKFNDLNLINDLKSNFITFNDADIAIQLYNFYKRDFFTKTLKYQFKIFDEVMLAPMGLFYPDLFMIPGDNNPNSNGDYLDESDPVESKILKFNQRMKFKNSLFPKSIDIYDDSFNDPISEAQLNVINNNLVVQMDETKLINYITGLNSTTLTNINNNARSINIDVTCSSRKDTPTPEDSIPSSLIKTNTNSSSNKIITPVAPLDYAIIESITQATRTDLTKSKKFYENILIVGGGAAKIPSFVLILSDRIGIWRPEILTSTALADIVQSNLNSIKPIVNNSARQTPTPSTEDSNSNINGNTNANTNTNTNTNTNVSNNVINTPSIPRSSMISIPISIMSSPREMDPQEITWKGGSVFSKLKIMNELWISPNDWDLLGSRGLQYKTIFSF